MEKRNTILLTVIAIATLLVAVVGATFAYFTAQTTANGEGKSVDVNTTELKGANITYEAVEDQFNLLNYPGGLGVFGSKITIAKADEGSDDHDYQATYNLKITYTNPTNTDLEWQLYMVPSEYASLNAAETTTCALQQKTDTATGKTMFWYGDVGDNGQSETTTCSGSAIISKITTAQDSGLGGKLIAEGKLLHGKTDATISKESKNAEEDQDQLNEGTYDDNLANRTINTSNLKSKYYYLVVKYPNSGDQSSDAGKQIKVSLTLDGKPASTLYTPEN